jgi:hypothetical protein
MLRMERLGGGEVSGLAIHHPDSKLIDSSNQSL